MFMRTRPAPVSGSKRGEEVLESCSGSLKTPSFISSTSSRKVGVVVMLPWSMLSCLIIDVMAIYLRFS